MRVCGAVLGLAGILFCGAAARAQKAVYGQASGANLQFPNAAHVYGATFGILDMKVVGPVALGADFRGAMMMRGGRYGEYTGSALDEGLLGFRASASPHVLPFSAKPYAEALIGLGYWRGGLNTARQDANHSMEEAVVGIDVPVWHRVEWRVAEFTYGRAGALPGHINPESLSSGFVIQLP